MTEPSVVLAIAGSSLLSAITYPLGRRFLHCAPPIRRVEILAAWLAFPALLGVTVGILAVVRGYGSWPPTSDLHWAVIVTVGSLVWIALARSARRLLRVRSTLSALVRTAFHDPQLRIDVVDSSDWFSFATSVDKGHVIVSSALRSTLSPDSLAIVLRHERAHLSQRHPQIRAFAALVSVLHLPVIRRRLMRELALACEQASDSLAARTEDERLAVADVLLQVARHSGGDPLPAASPMCAFHGDHLRQRIMSLLMP